MAGQAVVIVAGVVVLLAGAGCAPARDIGLAVLLVASRGRGRLPRRAALDRHPDSRWRRTIDDVRNGLLARDVWPGVALLSAAVLAGHCTLFIFAAGGGRDTCRPRSWCRSCSWRCSRWGCR